MYKLYSNKYKLFAGINTHMYLRCWKLQDRPIEWSKYEAATTRIFIRSLMPLTKL